MHIDLAVAGAYFEDLAVFARHEANQMVAVGDLRMRVGARDG